MEHGPLRGYFKIESRDDPQKIREKVTGKVLTLAPALGPVVPALLALLDVPADEAAWHALDPLQRRQQTLDAVKRLLLRESEVQPLVVVFEDLHWIDGETQTLLDSLVDSLPARAPRAPRQLPSRVPARLGRQDLLSPASDRRPTALTSSRLTGWATRGSS
jgi:predicted ATPase